jgi:hypothetical protein
MDVVQALVLLILSALVDLALMNVRRRAWAHEEDQFRAALRLYRWSLLPVGYTGERDLHARR